MCMLSDQVIAFWRQVFLASPGSPHFHVNRCLIIIQKYQPFKVGMPHWRKNQYIAKKIYRTVYIWEVFMRYCWNLFQSRSVDKQHAVITVNTENSEYKLHDLGTLNGVSIDSIMCHIFDDDVHEECMCSCFTLPCV